MQQLPNVIAGQWQRALSANYLSVLNPATCESLGEVPLSRDDDVASAVAAGDRAFEKWRRVPVNERVQFLFRLKMLLERDLDELARLITLECGKTLAESKAELRRGIENVETACGIPSMLQGVNNEGIAPGIDEHMFRQPLGVVAAITPFNFPAMIPLWFLPYAIACGNAFILKPSEKVPFTSHRLFELLAESGLPPGVAQLVHGDRETVLSLVKHPCVQAISLVGSTPVARSIYAQSAAVGKRAQCQGGAKNPTVILPDADLDSTTQIVIDSAFGCAGQRCLATSLVILVGEAKTPFTKALCELAESRRVGPGSEQGTEMGPVISHASKTRIEAMIAEGGATGARIRLDGRGKQVAGCEQGSFVFPTVLDDVHPSMKLAQTEIFGPVLSLVHADTLDDALTIINSLSHGNMACLFTSSGAAAHQFRQQAVVGNVGINVGVAAPMAFFPFSGWKDSFFGDLHAQGPHAIEFFTQTKVVVERWNAAWSRKF